MFGLIGYEGYDQLSFLQSPTELTEEQWTELVDKVSASEWANMVADDQVTQAYSDEVYDRVLIALVKEHGFRQVTVPEHSMYQGMYKKEKQQKGQGYWVQGPGAPLVLVMHL